MSAAPRHRLDTRARPHGRHVARASPGHPLVARAATAGAVTAVALGGAAAMTGGAATALPMLADQAPTSQVPLVHGGMIGGVTAAAAAAQVVVPSAPTTARAPTRDQRTPQPSRHTGTRTGDARATTDTVALRTGGRHAAPVPVPVAAPATAARTVAPSLLPGCPSPDATADLANGQIPDADLCTIPGTAQRLRSDAAAGWVALATAYAKEFGHAPRITDSYRPLAVQQALFVRKPTLAAEPGTSNHGLGIALDLADGIERTGTPAHTWMVEHATAFGWTNPAWAQPGGSKLEPWHWEYAAPAA